MVFGVLSFLEKKAMGTARFGTYPVWCAIRCSSCDAKSWMLRRVWGGGGGGDRAECIGLIVSRFGTSFDGLLRTGQVASNEVISIVIQLLFVFLL